MIPRWVVICWCLLLPSCGGAKKAAEPEYPPILPLCFVEEYPNESLGLHWDALVPLKCKEVLVLPLYRDLTLDGQKHKDVLWNPFVFNPNDDIEAILTKRGQREKLHRILIWLPGYLPTAIPTSFRYEWEVNGNGITSTVMELHKENLDKGSPTRMAKALQELLKTTGFKVTPYVDTRQDYEPNSLVRAVEYGSQYNEEHSLRGVRGWYVLWALNIGTEISVVVAADERRDAVTKFLNQYADADLEKGDGNKERETEKRVGSDQRPALPPD